MITLREAAYAKVNLTLDVLGKREDGYHDLCSVMQTVSLQDDILLELGTGAPWQLCSEGGQIPCDGRNLAWKAAKLFFDSTGHDPQGLRITVRKRIPSQAGLGGGSADAAAVLRMLNRHYGEAFSRQELCRLSEQIGSDVPFCVLGGTALAQGRGERLTPLQPAPLMHFVLCKPQLSFSTPELFRCLDNSPIDRRPDQEKMLQALKMGEIGQVGRQLCNVFEAAVLPHYPEIGRLKDRLTALGAQGAQLTGSGSVVFGIFKDEAQAEAACLALKKDYPQTFTAHCV